MIFFFFFFLLIDFSLRNTLEKSSGIKEFLMSEGWKQKINFSGQLLMTATIKWLFGLAFPDREKQSGIRCAKRMN